MKDKAKTAFFPLLWVNAIAGVIALFLYGFDWFPTLLTVLTGITLFIWGITNGTEGSGVQGLFEWVRGKITRVINNVFGLVASIVVLICSIICVAWIVFTSRRLVFEHDTPVTVTVIDGIADTGTILGYATNDNSLEQRVSKPFSWNPLAPVNRKFTFIGEGIEAQTTDVTFSWDWRALWAAERRIAIPVKPAIALTYSEIRTDPHIIDRIDDLPANLRGDIPARLANTPSIGLHFRLDSASPLPFEISNVKVDITGASPQKEWQFPYYGEPFMAGASVPAGYVELSPERRAFQPQWNESYTVGGELKGALYSLRVFSKSGMKYHARLKADWRALHNKEYKGQFDSNEFVIDYPRDWRELIMSESECCVVFYCVADELIESLDELGLTQRSKVIVADPLSDEYFYTNPLPKTASVKVVKDGDQLEELIALLGANSIYPTRPRNCLLLDDKVFLQNDGRESSPADRGLLVEDKERAEKIRSTFERVWKSN